MNNVTIAGGTNNLPTANSIDPTQDVLPIYTSSLTATQGINRNTLLGLSSAPVGLTDSQTITNKTLTSPVLTGPSVSGTITGTYTLGGTPTFPSSVITLTGTQTLTNKTFTSPTINSPTITNASITADTISGYTTSTSGSIYGMSVVSSAFTTANIIPTSSIQNAAVTTTKTKLDVINFTFNSGSILDQSNTSTSYVDVTGSSTTYTAPVGNGVNLFLWADFECFTSTNASLYVFNVNDSVVGKCSYTEVTVGSHQHVTAMATVASGATVTIKLQMRQGSSGTGTIFTGNTRAAELLPRITGMAVSQ